MYFERLHENRVRRIIEPVILGEAEDIDYLSDDFMYCLNLGLIKIENGQITAGNRIYGEVFIRTLSYNTQFALQSTVKPAWVLPDGIDMNGLLAAFQDFWRENSDIWLVKYEYREAAPHLPLVVIWNLCYNGVTQRRSISKRVNIRGIDHDHCRDYIVKAGKIKWKILNMLK